MVFGGGANQSAASGPQDASGNALPGTPNPTGDGDRAATATGPTANTPTANTPTANTPTANTPSANTPTTIPPSSGRAVRQVSGGDLTSTLKSLLGGTGVSGSSFVAKGSDFMPVTTVIASSPIVIDAQLSAGENVGYISIVIAGPGPSVPPPGTPQVQNDGSVVYVSKGMGSSDGRHNDRIDLTVAVVRPDGSTLAAVETNSLTLKSAAADNAPLLLTTEQVTAMLDSPAWDAAVAAADALPARAGGNAFAPSNAQTSTSSPSSALETALAPR